MTVSPPALTATPQIRRHDLDALRAFAMLLGIVLHAILSFLEIPWVVQDQAKAPELGFVFAAIHGFRMPLFFLISGYFTAMLWRRRGLTGLLRQRTWRIAAPLGLGCVTIVPLMWIVVIAASVTAPVDADQDIWTAAVEGDIVAVEQFLVNGTSPDDLHPSLGITPLGMAALGDQREIAGLLLDAGADPSARYRDGNTPLHTAAFFGRADVAERLLAAGADIEAKNPQGETPQNSMRHGQAITEMIAGALQLPIDFEEVKAGRERIGTLIDQPAAAEVNPIWALLGAIVMGLMYFPFFHHLWFLWHLCWLVLGFALVVAVGRVLPRVPLPTMLIATPLCLIWLVPLTMLTQSFMVGDGGMPSFGPDTSAGLLPIPRVLAYYAIFFGFGALMYGRGGAVDRLGRGWWIQLPLALLLLPFALQLAHESPEAMEMIPDESARRVLTILGPVLYAWLMTFGLLGLCESVLRRERPWVRYVSDSSYWLYLVHLPLIIVGQAMLRDVELPALVKLTLLLVVSTSILLVSYQLMVRYTWIGRMLNGPRIRPGTPSPGHLSGEDSRPPSPS